jgi:hypothetical protein
MMREYGDALRKGEGKREGEDKAAPEPDATTGPAAEGNPDRADADHEDELVDDDQVVANEPSAGAEFSRADLGSFADSEPTGVDTRSMTTKDAANPPRPKTRRARKEQARRLRAIAKAAREADRKAMADR